jgi:hypothetical protein
MTRVLYLGVVLALLMSEWLAAPFVGGVTAMAADKSEPAAGHPLTDEDRVFLEQLRDAVANDKRSWIADHVRYPIDVTIGGKLLNVEREDQFLAHYDEIMNQRVRDAILRQTSGELFKNWQGTMIGDGEVWFYHGLEGSYSCREVRPPRRGITLDCTTPDPDRRWQPPRTGIIAINNDWVPPEERTR